MALRFLLVLVLLPSIANAQVTEFWPELDIYWRPAERQRTFLELSSSADRDTPKREATVGLYQDYLNLPSSYLRLGYRFTFSTHDASYRESRIVAEGTYRTYGTDLVRLLSRTRTELRWVNGEYSYRIRERLHFQRLSQMHHGPAWGPYITFEAYYDSRYNSISRLAGRIGTEAVLGGPKAIDVYVARQNNSRGSPRYVNALGVTLKLSY